MKISKIYFDMDGVLANFERGINEICGMDMPVQGKSTEEEDDRMWQAVKDASHFYDRLEPMEGAIDMYKELSSKYDCEILSAIPKPHRGIETAGEDKISWVKRILSSDMKINIVYSEEKKDYAKSKNTILIDDLDKNIKEWESFGGTGIQFESAEQVLEEIKIIENKDVKQVLDEALDEYIGGNAKHINVLIIGPTGCGKTSIVRQWLKENSERINHYWFLANCYLHEITKLNMASGSVIPLEQGQYFMYWDVKCMNIDNCITIIDHFDLPRADARPHLMNLVKGRKANTFIFDADNYYVKYYDVTLDNLGILIAIAWNVSHLGSVPLSEEEMAAFDYVIEM